MRICFLVLLAGLISACSNNAVPANVLPVQKMETIIWQLMQSDEYVNRLLLKDTLKKASIEKMKIYQQVFELNGTSLAEFKKSYAFYMGHPDITKTMFDSIAVRGSRQRSEGYKPKPIFTGKPAKNQ